MEAFQDHVSAQERIDILNAAIERATEMKNQVIKDSKYCETCGKYFFKSQCGIISREVKKSVCTNPLTGGYLDPYEYEERVVTEYCWTCPEHHEINGYTEWI